MLARSPCALAAPVPAGLLAAGIETPRAQLREVAGREVRLWIEVDELRACTAELARQGMELGFLVDPDQRGRRRQAQGIWTSCPAPV